MSDHATAHKPTRETPALSRRPGGDGIATRPKQARLDDDKVEIRVITTGLRAAQQALEDPTMSTPAMTARTHLAHVSESAAIYGGHDGGSVADAADAFDQALEHFLARHPRLSKDLEQLSDDNVALRRQLNLPASSVRSRYHPERGTAHAHALATLRPVLELMTTHATEGMQGLESFPNDDRNHVVAKLAGELDESVAYARWLSDQLSLEERAALKPALDAAATQLVKLLEWIRTRTAHAAMERSFMDVVRAFDVVLVDAGVERVEERTPALSERSIESGRQEQGTLGSAENALYRVFERVQIRQHAAITQFRQLAQAPDVETQNLIGDLATAVFVAALGHIGGFMIGAALSRASAAFAKAAKLAALPDAARSIALHIPAAVDTSGIVQRVVDVSTDSIQGIAGNALAASEKTDPHVRAREFFAGAMDIEIGDRTARMKQQLRQLIDRSEITPLQLHGLELLFETLLDGIKETYYQQTVNAWTSYMAQSSVGTRPGHEPNGKKLSEMRNYFGTQTPGGRVFGTSKQGTVGVFSIMLRIESAGRKPELDPGATSVNGMNSDMASAIVAGASHRLNAIWLPKEVHVTTGFGHAVIALDEKNEIRDVLRWDDVAQMVGIATASLFWRLYGKDIVLP